MYLTELKCVLGIKSEQGTKNREDSGKQFVYYFDEYERNKNIV